MKRFLKIQKHYKISRIGHRFLKYLSAFSIIPILLFSIPIFLFLTASSINRIGLELKNEVNRVAHEIDLLLEDAYQIGNTISRNPLVLETLNHEYESPEDLFLDETILNSELVKILRHAPPSIEAYLYGANGGRFKSSDKYFLNKSRDSLHWDDQLMGDSLWIKPYEGSLAVESLGEGRASLVVPIKSVLQENILGWLLMEIVLPESLFDPSIDELSTFFLMGDDETVLINREQIRIFNKGDDLPDLVRYNYGGIRYWDRAVGSDSAVLLENNKGITAYRHLKMNDWVLCKTISKSNTYTGLLVISLLTLGAILILILFSYFSAYRISRTLTKPILELSQTMAKVQKGDFTARAGILSDDEIADLGRDFNSMVVDITKLMDQIYEEQHRIKQYELMLLQAQINPHFLYNTLDSIIWLIRMNEVKDSIVMIQALTRFLRTGLSKGKDIISLKLEIENVTSYLMIQQLRYKNKLTFEIDLPDEILTQPIPKLILQPLVENAIYHGIKTKPEGGFIHLYGYEEEKDVIIVVSDDGVGMDAAKLEELSRPDIAEDSYNTGSYGFNNVRERLQLFFKDRCLLDIESREQEGTTITIRIKGR